MKRKIEELMVVHKKDRSTSSKSPDKLMLEFWDSEKATRTLNDIFPLVIITTIVHSTCRKYLPVAETFMI